MKIPKIFTPKDVAVFSVAIGIGFIYSIFEPLRFVDGFFLYTSSRVVVDFITE